MTSSPDEYAFLANPITDPEKLAELRKQNNPNNDPIGHFTGRCGLCASDDLECDVSVYACKRCGNFFFVGDLPPRVVCNHCRASFDLHAEHNCPVTKTAVIHS